VKIVRKHHFLVRLTHWANLPLLLGLILSGLSIYWASPVVKHSRNPRTGSDDYLADLGIWAVRHVPGQRGYGMPKAWFYDHASLGTFALAPALRLHWLFAYLFMACGALYLVGLVAGGGWRALVPRRTDVRDGFRMIRYYAGVVPARVLRKPWPHPPIEGKYNALQRAAYVSIPLAAAVSVATGWAMHKPVQLWWLARFFGGYDMARAWHLAAMLVLALFVIPHVVLVIADGWDTFRSMVTGLSAPVGGESHGRG